MSNFAMIVDLIPGCRSKWTTDTNRNTKEGSQESMPLKILVLTVIFVLPLVPTFWAIQEIPRRRFRTRRRKIVWFAVAATFPCVGALLYFLIERRHTVLAPEWGGPPVAPDSETDGENRS
jgi:uncharacterized membrane protein YhaH (DUF805 family)